MARVTITTTTGTTHDFFCPAAGGYVRLEGPGSTGTLGSQICDGGGTEGETLSATPETLQAVAVRWMGQRGIAVVEDRAITTYRVYDANGSIMVEANSPRAAAEEFASAFDAGDSTIWVSCRVQPLDDAGNPVGDYESHTVAVDPVEPECEGDHEHDWQSPYSVVGGIRENPGVWSSGGGVKRKTTCAHCGAYQLVDTWAQDPNTGEQGLESISYEDADDASIEWVQGRRDHAAIAALAKIAEVTIDSLGRLRITGYAPDSSGNGYDGDTSPGSAWDEECDRLRQAVRIALPSGWSIDWDDDDLRIEWEGA